MMRKAISEIIATIIVVGLTIVAAGVLYTFVSSTASRAEGVAQFQVMANLVVPSGQGTGTVAITIVNSGNIAITNIQLSGNIVPPGSIGWNPNPSPNSPIPPSGGTSTAVFPTKISVVAGVTYSFTVTVTFANGQTKTQIVELTATT